MECEDAPDYLGEVALQTRSALPGCHRRGGRPALAARRIESVQLRVPLSTVNREGSLRAADLEAICGVRGRHVAWVRAKQVVTVRTGRHQRASLDAVADDESLFDELVRDLQNAQELSGKLLVGFSATSTIHTVHARRTVMIPSPGSPCEKSKLWSYDWVKIGTLWSLQRGFRSCQNSIYEGGK
jgi:hypothetical protein